LVVTRDPEERDPPLDKLDGRTIRAAFHVWERAAMVAHKGSLRVIDRTPPEDEPICYYCATESDDGCHHCDINWCNADRYEHECPHETEG
jgi:hypothetical protein